MNTFQHLHDQEGDVNDIKDEKAYRNRKKKLRNLEHKPPTPENMNKRKRLQVEIQEYELTMKEQEEQKEKKQNKKPNKKQNKKPKTDDDTFLDQAYQESKHPDFQRLKEEIERQKRLEIEKIKQAQKQTRERIEEEDRERKQEEARERERKRKQKREEEVLQNSTRELLIMLRKADAPKDILDLAKDYNKKKYMSLCKKYHPDKGGSTELQWLVEDVKNHYQPIGPWESDETWRK